MELAEREAEIIRILRRLMHEDFVLVGGYAVSSLAGHRFSVDCDLAVPSHADGIKTLLRQEGYSLHKAAEHFDSAYGGRFESHAKKINSASVTVDLLIGSLASRSTGASWGFDYIKKHSVTSYVGSPAVRCRIPERELLAAMKIHSGRDADIRDIVMLIERCDLEKVAAHAKRGDMKLLDGKMAGILDALEDERLTDSLKGVFRLERDVNMDIKRAKSAMLKIKSLLTM